jgi:hypothetical protein
LLSKDGPSLFRSREAQLKRFTKYFAEVLSSGCVNPQQQEHMKGMTAQLEGTVRVLSDSSSAGSSGGSGSVGSSSSSTDAAAPSPLQEAAKAIVTQQLTTVWPR